MTDLEIKVNAYVLHALPGCPEPVMLPRGTRFIPVSPELLKQCDGEWSEPVRVRLDALDNGLVEMTLQSA